MAGIPEDVIIEILLLLPVVSLLRFRCVSKKWRDLIDSYDFAKSHQERSKAQLMLIFCRVTGAYYVDFNSICTVNPLPILNQITRPWPRFVYMSDYFCVLGICNGVMCINVPDSGILLWNPSTRRHVHVRLSSEVSKVVPWCWGFGYDSDLDDYKVVYIAYMGSEYDGSSPSSASAVWVYSHRSGLWKNIGDFPSHILELHLLDYQSIIMQPGVFVGGALHWDLHPCYDTPDLILAFNLAKLEFYLVPHPEFRCKGVFLNLGVLDGCLYAIADDYDARGFDFWVMKEYGVKESWTKLITCSGYNTGLTPLSYTKKDEELVFVTATNEIIRYEFATRTFRGIMYCSSPALGEPRLYTPTLVFPQSDVHASDDIPVEETAT